MDLCAHSISLQITDTHCSHIDSLDVKPYFSHLLRQCVQAVVEIDVTSLRMMILDARRVVEEAMAACVPASAGGTDGDGDTSSLLAPLTEEEKEEEKEKERKRLKAKEDAYYEDWGNTDDEDEDEEEEEEEEEGTQGGKKMSREEKATAKEKEAKETLYASEEARLILEMERASRAALDKRFQDLVNEAFRPLGDGSKWLFLNAQGESFGTLCASNIRIFSKTYLLSIFKYSVSV